MIRPTAVTALILNPNTSAEVTRRLTRQIRAALAPADRPEPGDEPASGPRIRLRSATARFGARYIASEAGFAIAGHATLDAWARATRGGPVDAVIVGCFGDPGLTALRDLTPVPVIGLAEAAVAQAATHGRFAIVTGGTAWRPMLQRIVAGMPQADRLDDIVVIAASGGALADDPDRARRLLAAACRRAARPGVEAIVLGGAGFAGMGDRLAGVVPIPVIDSVSAAARALEARLGAAPRRRSGDDRLAGDRGASPAPDRSNPATEAPAQAPFKGLAKVLLTRLNPVH